MSKSPKIEIAPSLLAADFLKLGQVVTLINESEADWIHLDVMDGRFVPNISFGIPIISQVKKIAKIPLDVHLMIVEPEKFIEKFYLAGANQLTIHLEACQNLHSNLQHIRSLGMKAGVAINPHTPVLLLQDILDEIDVVLIMSVNPGFGGQKFIIHTLEKIRELRLLLNKSSSKAKIEVDGGISLDNANSLRVAGAEILVAGSQIFNSKNPKEIISKLRNI